MTPKGYRLVLPRGDLKDLKNIPDVAWACGSWALDYLEDGMGMIVRRHAEAFSKGSLPSPDEDNVIRLPWDVWNRARQFTAHLIGAEFERRDRVRRVMRAAAKVGVSS